MQEYYCSTQSLAIGYDGKPLLQNIDIGVRRGEVLTLIGPNGAGKSTLLKTLAGQLAIQGGTVLLSGRSLTEYTGGERARKMALMLPHTRRTELTTCFEFAAAGRHPYTGRLGVLSAEDKRQVQKALALVGAEALAPQDFNKISDGQRQRVLLARAICQQPELVLLDEPTSFLDIKGKLELLELLKTLAHGQNTAVIVSLHELDLAQKVSDRVVCVSPQGVSQPGTPEDVFTPENIRALYGVIQGEYNALYGSVELARPTGAPDIFVIGGGGHGVPFYRRLQRKSLSFYAGILYESDLDIPVARALAAEVVCQTAFEPAGPAQYEQARRLVDRCGRVLCAPQSAGVLNEQNLRLRAYAEEQGKLVKMDGL